MSGRGERIRTFDLLNPIQVRYQTALRHDRAAHYDPESILRPWKRRLPAATVRSWRLTIPIAIRTAPSTADSPPTIARTILPCSLVTPESHSPPRRPARP